MIPSVVANRQNHNRLKSLNYLFRSGSKAHGDGILDKQLTILSRPKLLLIDELGYLPFEANAAHLSFQLISRHYERGSILITSNRPVGEWGSVFSDPAMTLAAVDRLVHHANIFEMNVESYRRRSALQRQACAGRPPISHCLA